MTKEERDAVGELIACTVSLMQTVYFATYHKIVTLPELRKAYPQDVEIVDKVTALCE